MISSWRLPKTYIHRFIKQSLSDPFELLLDEEGHATRKFHTFKTREAKIKEALKRIYHAEKLVKEHLAEIEGEEIPISEANRLRLVTEIRKEQEDEEIDISKRIIEI